MEKFNIGDIVVSNSFGKGKSQINGDWILEEGEVFEVTSLSGENVFVKVLMSEDYKCNGEIKEFKEKYLMIDNRFEAERLERFMVYGTGCDNKSKLFVSERKMSNRAKEESKNSDWTGEIIGYKLTPIFKVEKKTILKKVNK